MLVIVLAWLFALLSPSPQSVFAQTAGALVPNAKIQLFDNAGLVVSGGKLCTYAAGTTTPQATYSDSALMSANANPVMLDSAGRATVYLSAVNYKLVLFTAGTDSTCSTGTQLWSQDNVEDIGQVFLAKTQTANMVFAGPSTGAAAAPTFRSLVTADISALGSLPWTVATSTSTGTLNDFAPGLSNNTILRMNNATLATIDGFAGGVAGQVVVVVSVGAGEVDFAHQNTGSTAANRLINFATSGITPLAAGVGTATYVYDGTTARWRLVQHEQGDWITPAFSAGLYTASVSTWTVTSGEVTDYRYYLKGRELSFAFNVQNSTAGGGGLELRITLPNSYALAMGDIFQPAIVNDNAGGFVTGAWEAASTATFIRFYKLAALTGNWSAATTATSVFGAGIVRIS